jgi:signal transduction histidine kinase/CheY-like chemotaxis protein
LKANEILGQHMSRFYTEAERAAGLPMKALRTAAEKGRYDAEGWRVRKDGSLFWASVVLDSIRDENGDLLGFAKITRDITDRKKAEQELQRAQQQLAHSQKMEAIGQLTGGVAHDFNNLLMVVSGQTEILRGRLGEDPRALRAIDAIASSARRGEELTRHLLSFARRQRRDASSLTIRDQFNHLRELLAASLPATVSLVVDLPEDLWPIIADPSELELAVLNMAVNARDAMPEGGVLTVTADNCTLEDGDELTGEFVALAISDTGQGIPPDILAKIFDPFFTTKAIDKGTGLGLSQVYGFAQQSGGRVTVKSELGRGTTFTLLLPRALNAPVEGEAQPEAPTIEGANILLVEDNPEVADTAHSLLEQLGHRVTLASSAQAALRAIAEEVPDLVFSDIVMAGSIDGLGLARQLRKKHPALPILLATGYSQALQGADHEFPVLRKPYRLPDLNRAISVLLAETRATNLVPIESARRKRGATAD